MLSGRERPTSDMNDRSPIRVVSPGTSADSGIAKMPLRAVGPLSAADEDEANQSRTEEYRSGGFRCRIGVDWSVGVVNLSLESSFG
jgi:hypothetical protein